MIISFLKKYKNYFFDLLIIYGKLSDPSPLTIGKSPFTFTTIFILVEPLALLKTTSPLLIL